MQYDKEIQEKTGIFVFENALSENLCDEIIKKFYESPKKFAGQLAKGVDKKEKNTTDWYVDDLKVENKLFIILNLAKEAVFNKFHHMKRHPEDFFGWCGFQFQKNEAGKGYFKQHIDFDLTCSDQYIRILAPIFYLNDVEKGGCTKFPIQGISIKPKKGTLVVFPCTWEYLHQGEIPISNNKYIITNFLVNRKA